MSEPKPADFPIGSIESRAAMRLQLGKQKTQPYVGLISRVPRPWHGEGPPPSDWNLAPRIQDHKLAPGALTLYIPFGMSEEEARRITGAPGRCDS